ncbi:MAG: hypothetical protein P8J91_00500 [Pirellulaceae bacterium]|nr:hypothetical protein [Pirellulaceae bacterium]MDG2102200.1 hypothetical protein [Pirellulaceae bacterium]
MSSAPGGEPVHCHVSRYVSPFKMGKSAGNPSSGIAFMEQTFGGYTVESSTVTFGTEQIIWGGKLQLGTSTEAKDASRSKPGPRDQAAFR